MEHGELNGFSGNVGFDGGNGKQMIQIVLSSSYFPAMKTSHWNEIDLTWIEQVWIMLRANYLVEKVKMKKVKRIIEFRFIINLIQKNKAPESTVYSTSISIFATLSKSVHLSYWIRETKRIWVNYWRVCWVQFYLVRSRGMKMFELQAATWILIQP